MPKLLFYIVLFACFSLAVAVQASDIGKVFPSEKTSWTDPATQRVFAVLTKSGFNDSKPYQTHDTWTTDGKWIVFRSNRNGRDSQIFLVNEENGQIVQLTDDVIDSSTMNLSRKEMKMFYKRGSDKQLPQQLVELNIGKLLADVQNKSVKVPETYTRIIADLPDTSRITSFALDAAENKVYYGTIISAPPKDDLQAAGWKSRLDYVDLTTGKSLKIIDIPFRIGHVQANPWKENEVFYCDETGGDTLLRIWSVLADGKENHAVYQETPDEWVTHEVVCGQDEIIFIVSGHGAKLRTKPSGVVLENLRTKEVKLLGQTEEKSGGFWHCNATPKSLFAVADTHAGSIYLINRTTGEQILLTKGHPEKPDHTHPIFSPDGKRVLIQTGILNGGKSLDLMTVEAGK